MPKNVTVPKVVGAKSVFAAQQKLTDAHLVVGDREQRPTSKVPPGTVLAQSPKAGEKAKKGAAVTLQIAVGEGKVTVPQLAGLTLPQADRRLRSRKLTKGQTSVTPPDLKAKIARTLPAAGETVPEGTAMDIYYG